MKIFSSLMALIWMSASLAFAQEQALVVSSTPVLQMGSDQQARIAYYNVVYDYAGKRYSAQMPSDPGQFVAIQVTPVAPPVAGLPLTEAPMGTWVQNAPPMAMTPPVAPVYISPYAYPYSPVYYGPAPFMFSVGVGYHRGYGRHWR
jgi:hypothetical protein